MIQTRRWCDKVSDEGGIKVLVCRYRPRAVPKKDETWTIWKKDLGPSKELHAAFYGKTGAEAISWEEFARRYREEMQTQEDEIAVLAEMAVAGKSITLMCSSACTSELRCHRSLLRQLIEEQMAAPTPV
jgi:uncharacterized protein YeaO (DUF488 family)